MKRKKLYSFAHTNIEHFYAIASNSFERMKTSMGRSAPPAPGEPFVISHERLDTEFHDALIASAFCSIYLETLLYHLLIQRFGEEDHKKYDRKSYKEKLTVLGCEDPTLLEEAEHQRIVRRELVHEKAHIDRRTIRSAQGEAWRAFDFIKAINVHFKVNMG